MKISSNHYAISSVIKIYFANDIRNIFPITFFENNDIITALKNFGKDIQIKK